MHMAHHQDISAGASRRLRRWLPILAVLAGCDMASSVNTDPDAHSEVVDRSRRDGTIVISLDTVFSSGQPYAVMVSEPVTLPGRVRPVGSRILLLSGAPAIRIVPIVLYGDHYLAWQFDDGRFIDTAYTAYQESMLNDAQTLVRAQLLERDAIARPSAQAFVLANGKPPYREPRRSELVVRDKSQPISVTTSRQIWQTGVRIGHYDSTAFSIGGMWFHQISIYHIDSTHCATSTNAAHPADTSAAVFTTRDRKSRDVRRPEDTPLLQGVLWYLVNQSYL